MTELSSLIRSHPVAAYVALAAGFSWAYWIPMALRGEVVTPGGSVSHFPGLLGPMLAALVVTAVIDGRGGILDLLSRMARWRVGFRWYLVAAVPFLVFLATVAVMQVTGAAAPDLIELAEFSGLPAMWFPLVVLLAFAVNGFGEETGWRGFLTPRLLGRHGMLTTSLLVAAVWIAWHVPSFAVIETYRQMGLAIIPMMGIGVTSGAIILTWLYVGSGSSILIVSLWHLALNVSSATTAGRGLPGAIVWTAVLVWAMVIVVRWIIASEPATRPLMTRLRDGFLIAYLHSPLGRGVRGMTVISFRGRRSGRRLMTPVECVHEAGQLFVLVANPDQKQWWRNVAADPAITVELDGRDVPARAVVHALGDPGAAADLEACLRARPRLARAFRLPADWPTNREAVAAAAARLVSVRIDVPSPGRA